MKKTILTVVMALHCLIFEANAQDQKAIDVTTKGIQIGEKVPDILLNNLYNFKDIKGNPASTAKLSDFKGKLVILDFWATWCGACLDMIPRMESLQNQFSDKIQFIKVTYQSSKQVLPFLEKFKKGRRSVFPELTDDKALHKLFPHIYLPHYIWIDKEGTVAAITGLEEINSEKINKMLTVPSAAGLTSKHDMSVTYNRNKPLFISENGGDGSSTVAHSIFSGYTEGINGGYTINKDSGAYSKITVTNRGVVGLYQVAYSNKGDIGRNRTIVLSKDSTNLLPTSSGKTYLDWMRAGNGFCYELLLPNPQQQQLFPRMTMELDSYFPQYQVSLDKIKTKCLILTKLPNAAKSLDPKGTASQLEYSRTGVVLANISFAEFIEQMKVIYFQKQFPLIDESGIKGNVDLTFSADMTNLSSVNAALATYGLEFQVAERVIEMLVIKDRISLSTTSGHAKEQ